MENLDEALDKLLNDPDVMAQVMNVAQSLGSKLPQDAPEPKNSDVPIQGLSSMLTQLQGDNRHTALFQALRPYLSPKRREKLEKAMQLARLSSLASFALQHTDREE